MFEANNFIKQYSHHEIGTELSNSLKVTCATLVPINRVFAFKIPTCHKSGMNFGSLDLPPVRNCSFTGNYIHAQTFACLQNWLTDLEIFATLVAAIIHDYEHTGTTNNFHVMSGSDTALLYNDRAVLENHHISASFRYVGNNVVTRIVVFLPPPHHCPPFSFQFANRYSQERQRSWSLVNLAIEMIIDGQHDARNVNP